MNVCFRIFRFVSTFSATVEHPMLDFFLPTQYLQFLFREHPLTESLLPSELTELADVLPVGAFEPWVVTQHDAVECGTSATWPIIM